eukprot:TRINITY_DN34536_c0_g1_i1.p1 TRINITY_DN34536_c0_g1~~TRINITY_DN34536_c0_g1_i1.p1  ORF type:complete len:749 (+),score=116.60 TRINITY_DN34536_c0_g1_i1:50-2296(+)
MGDLDDDVAQALAMLRKQDEFHGSKPSLAAANVSMDELNSYLNEDTSQVSLKPIGPNWGRPGTLAQLPRVPGHPTSAWLMHERQDASGRYRPWLFFSTLTGKYFQVDDAGKNFLPMETPHNPWTTHLKVRVGGVSMQHDSSMKLDTMVLLPDLPKTGFLLKQPLEFLDKPASLFVLCAGLRNTGVASEFCAKRLHTLLLPKLSSRATLWYDYELLDMLREATKTLDGLLLQSSSSLAGCSLSAALLVGTRLVISSLGSIRCILCRPCSAAAQKVTPNMSTAAVTPWQAQLVVGGKSHTLADQTEVALLELKSPGILGSGVQVLTGESARPSYIASAADEWEREMRRVTHAKNSFAVLGAGPLAVKEGSASIRKDFRRRSLIVHPDKVGEARRQQSTPIFSKLQAAADRIEAMLQQDIAATVLLAEIHSAHDEGRLHADPAAAAKLLGVNEGCTLAKAEEATKNKFEAALNRLQDIARPDVDRALKILEIARGTVVRGTQIWMPSEMDIGVHVTRGLGCKDLKKPVLLLNTEASVEIVHLGLNEVAGLAFVTDDAEMLSDDRIAEHLSQHTPVRPRAAALKIAQDTTQHGDGQGPQKIPSVVCAYFSGEAEEDDTLPALKRLRTANPQHIRVSHILLRWAGMKIEDEFVRPNMALPTRSQAEAENQLLALLEDLLAPRQPKTLAARFKAAVIQHSECSSALKVPHADLGWLEPGYSEPAFEAAACDTPIGSLSDVVLTSRGAHLLFRLG